MCINLYTRIYVPLCHSPGDVVGQFIAAPPTCPNDTFTFTCTVDGDRSQVTHWRVGMATINMACSLLHSTANRIMCGPNNAFTAIPGSGFGRVNAISFSSTLTGTAALLLDDTVIECFGPGTTVTFGNRVGNSTLQVLGMLILSALIHKC